MWCQKLMAGGYIRPIIMVDVSDVSISIDASRSKFVGGDELYLFDVCYLFFLFIVYLFLVVGRSISKQ